MEQDKLYIIACQKGYIGHPNWRVTQKIGNAMIFAELDMAQQVAEKVKGVVAELVVGEVIPRKEG